MQPGSRKGGAKLETFEEMNWSAEVLDEVPGQHAYELSVTLDQEPPREVSREDIWMIMKGIERTLAIDGLIGREALEQVKSDYEEVTSPEHQEEIVQWFIPNVTPEGGAPEEIREQWLDIPLPVRSSNVSSPDLIGDYAVGANINDPTDVKVSEPSAYVVVNAIDAFKALRLAGRNEVADWWENWFLHRDPMLGTRLMFQSDEGKLVAADERINSEIDNILPGFREFDAQTVASPNIQ